MSNQSKPHILIIPSWYPRFKGDISGSFFREQSLALLKKQCKVGIIFPEYRSMKDWRGLFNKPYGLTIENDSGLFTYRWHSVVFTPKFQNYNIKCWVKIGLKLFENYINQHGRPDVLHVHSMLKGGFLAHAIYKKYGIPFVITEHCSIFLKNELSRENINSLMEIIGDANSCIAVSETFKNQLNEIFETNKWAYIPNIVNEKFTQQEIKVKENIDNFIYGSISLLTKNKRVDLLIHSFSEILKKYPNSILYIVGDGPEKNNLMEKVNKLNINNNIKFYGLLTRDNIVSILQNINCLVISSEFETFGVVAVEALALGKPVVSTKCGGPESIINSKVGYLVENNSEIDLINGLIDIQKNYKNFSSQEIREYCLNNFSEDIIVGKLKKIYSEILEYNKNNE